jgi:Protein of unknown function (DUF5132)
MAQPVFPHKLPITGPFLLGIVVAPLAGAVVKPLLRGTVKAAITLGLQVKRLAAEAAEEVQGIAFEAMVDQAASAPAPPAAAPPAASAPAAAPPAAAVVVPRKASAPPVPAPKKA